MSLFDNLDDGREREITRGQYIHSREVLPPVAYDFTFAGERWDFGFAEGRDYVVAFRREGDRCYARKTPYVNPLECGRGIAEQQQRPEPPLPGKLSARHLDAVLGRLHERGCVREADELRTHIRWLENERDTVTRYYEEVVIPGIEGRPLGPWTGWAGGRSQGGEPTR